MISMSFVSVIMYRTVWNTQSNLVITNFKCLSILIWYVLVSWTVQNVLQSLNLALVSTWECHSYHLHTNNLSRKMCKKWLHFFPSPHLDSTIPNQIHNDTTYNEQLRHNFFHLVHLKHVTSYKVCLAIWTPLFSLVLTSNVRISLRN